MINHYIQKDIIRVLVESDQARYRDIKPSNLDGNTFAYHLKSLVSEGFVTKNANGRYQLSAKGKLLGINISLKKGDQLTQPHSIILIYAKNEDKWLLRKRLVQPALDKIGFIHGEPNAKISVSESAKEVFKRRTNLSCEVEFIGSGYIRLTSDDELISFVHFSLFEAKDIKGKFKEKDSHGENIWIDSPDFKSPDMIPSMKDLANMIRSSTPFVDLLY